MSKITIIEGNANDKDNLRALMVKGEKGDDGVSPTVKAVRSGKGVNITATDNEGTTTARVEDGISPTVKASKTGGVTTITITDLNGTRTSKINDGEVSQQSLTETLRNYPTNASLESTLKGYQIEGKSTDTYNLIGYGFDENNQLMTNNPVDLKLFFTRKNGIITLRVQTHPFVTYGYVAFFNQDNTPFNTPDKYKALNNSKMRTIIKDNTNNLLLSVVPYDNMVISHDGQEVFTGTGLVVENLSSNNQTTRKDFNVWQNFIYMGNDLTT